MNATRVEVYWNIRKKVFSVRALSGRSRGRVVAHMSSLHLRNATFVVQKAGRERVLREKRKNVHALVRGTLDLECSTLRSGTEVRYNPYLHKTFVTAEIEHASVTQAKRVRLATRKDGSPSILASGARLGPIHNR